MMLQTGGVIFISGDVHFGEIARFDCGLTYPVYDITSSGLTQAVEEEASTIFSYILAIGSWLLPHTMRVKNSRCATNSCVYGRKYFPFLPDNLEPYVACIESIDIAIG
jgi:alkaline phosphatase D